MKKVIVLSFLSFFISYLSFGQNVGIGTTSPVSKLHVKGTGTGTQIILEENAGSILRISNEPSGTGPYIGTTTNNSLSLVTNNAVRATISSTGNVGIGTTSPQQQLSVAGGVVIDQNNNNTGTTAAMLSFGGSSGEGIGSKRTSGTNQYGLDFYTNGINRMTVANSGNIGINIINPSSKLEIRGALGFSSTTKKWELSYDSTNSYFYIDEFGSGRRLAIKNGGNVGINTTNPQSTLDVNGDINIENKLLLNNTAGTVGQVITSGGPGSPAIWANTAYGTSDRFLFVTSNSNTINGANFQDTLLFNTVYALSGAISYNNANGVFTINKSGLYSFKGSFSGSVFSTTNGGSYVSAYLYTSGATMTLGIRTNGLSGLGSNFANSDIIPLDNQLYFSAGSTFYFQGVLYANVAVSTAFFSQTPVSITLISE